MVAWGDDTNTYTNKNCIVFTQVDKRLSIQAMLLSANSKSTARKKILSQKLQEQRDRKKFRTSTETKVFLKKPPSTDTRPF